MFRMWGERGLVATFFADVYQIGDLAEIQSLLRTAGLCTGSPGNDVAPHGVDIIIEPDFGNVGFGHPDAILRLDYTEKRTVVVVEAKRTSFKKACVPSRQRGTDKFNSTLNGQLELDYRLCLALSIFKDGDGELIEPQWILTTPYCTEVEGSRLHYVRNPEVLQKIALRVSGQSIDQYYYLVITTDKENPLDTVAEGLLPQLFVPDPENSVNPRNGWAEIRGKFGWLNYAKMRDFIGGVQDQLPLGSLFLPTYQLNEGNLGGERRISL